MGEELIDVNGHGVTLFFYMCFLASVIVIGALLLVFIVLQKLISGRGEQGLIAGG